MPERIPSNDGILASISSSPLTASPHFSLIMFLNSTNSLPNFSINFFRSCWRLAMAALILPFTSSNLAFASSISFPRSPKAPRPSFNLALIWSRTSFSASSASALPHASCAPMFNPSNLEVIWSTLNFVFRVLVTDATVDSKEAVTSSSPLRLTLIVVSAIFYFSLTNRWSIAFRIGTSSIRVSMLSMSDTVDCDFTTAICDITCTSCFRLGA